MNKNIFFKAPQSFFFQFGLGFIFHQFCDLCLTQKHLKAVNLRGPGYTQFVKHCRRVFPVTAQVRSFLMCLLSRPSPFQNNVLCHKTMGWKNPKSGATKALIWDYRNGCPKSKPVETQELQGVWITGCLVASNSWGNTLYFQDPSAPGQVPISPCISIDWLPLKINFLNSGYIYIFIKLSLLGSLWNPLLEHPVIFHTISLRSQGKWRV